MEQFKTFLEKKFDLKGRNSPTDRDWEIISSHLRREEFSKKHTLIETGQTERTLSFIEKGIIRFFMPKEENDLTFNIVFENGFLSAYDSLLTQTPSSYSIETLTDTVLWRIDYDSLQAVYKETNFGDFIGRLASEELFLKKQKRELSLLNHTAEQRYLNLFNEQPRLVQQIPLKYIAAYIGITPQALSRIRKRIYSS
ncbi:Crp/Fnr family transcriptional regulator [Limibacter armeniacum]|uniref:Crp/Fnr family transcriptional regulator n=1 Tax=Limibacter armeniacum TaxID=466084 RepID=UPI002FE59013